MMYMLPYPEVYSKTVPAKKLVVWLHGIGVDGNNLVDLMRYMQNDLKDCHFMAPHGVEPYDNATYGRQWFSLQDRSPHVMQKLLAQNIAPLTHIIQQKQVALQLTNRETVIIGFSQGAMIGLYLTLVQEEPFLATAVFSGLLVTPPYCINTSTPICCIHGALDTVIPIAAMEDLIHYLTQHHIPHRSYRLPHLAHSIDDGGLQQAVAFINKASSPIKGIF